MKNFKKIASLLHFIKKIIYYEDIDNYFFIDYCILYCMVIDYIKENLEYLDILNHDQFIYEIVSMVLYFKKRNLIFLKNNLKI